MRDHCGYPDAAMPAPSVVQGVVGAEPESRVRSVASHRGLAKDAEGQQGDVSSIANRSEPSVAPPRQQPTAPRAGFRILRVADLAAADWESIWALVAQFFEVDRGYTEPLLRSREYIVLFEAEGVPMLAGMSTFDVLPVVHEGRRVVAIYSSYVLLREAYRGLNLVQKSGFASFLRVKLRHPLRPVLWFFDSFSIKSYLLLPRNFDTYWPRHDRPTPAWEHGLMDRLARHVHGALWQPGQGVARRSGRERLRPGVAPLPGPAECTPEVAHFAKANPGHGEGDVLVCLAPLSLANWWGLARRAWRRARRPPTSQA